jgi:hypothetical protein
MKAATLQDDQQRQIQYDLEGHKSIPSVGMLFAIQRCHSCVHAELQDLQQLILPTAPHPQVGQRFVRDAAVSADNRAHAPQHRTCAEYVASPVGGVGSWLQLLALQPQHVHLHLTELPLS